MISFGELRLKDFGPYATATLALRNQGLVLIKGDNQDTTAADSNGSGKSHIFKALAWCLFGDSLDGEKTDEVIRRGAKSAWVSVTFKDDHGTEFEVRRTRTKTSATLELFTDGEAETGAITKDTQSRVVEIIGLDFKAFVNTVLYGQGDIKHFADPETKDPERKAVLKRLLRLEVVDGALKYAKAKHAEAERRQAECESKIPVLDAKIGAIDIDAFDRRIAELKGRKGEATKKVSRAPKLKSALESIEGVLADLDKAKRKLQDAQAAERKVETAASFLNFQATGEKQAADKARARVNLFKDGKCPTCGSSGETICAELDALNAEVAARVQAEAELKEKRTQMLEQAKEHKAAIVELKAEVAEEFAWRDKLVNVKAELKSIESAVAAEKTADADLKRLSGERKEAMANLKLLGEQKDLAEAQASLAAEEANHWSFWVRGFGNQGIPSFVMDTITPELQEATNQYLGILSDGDITVTIDTESKLKGGELRDKFSILASGPDIMGRPSTGQQKKINIAADLGLMNLAASRERAGIDLLLLDEILDGLDASGKARVVDLLLELRKTRSSIFVISHDPSLAEVFEKVVTVTKEDGVARLA